MHVQTIQYHVYPIRQLTCVYSSYIQHCFLQKYSFMACIIILCVRVILHYTDQCYVHSRPIIIIYCNIFCSQIVCVLFSIAGVALLSVFSNNSQCQPADSSNHTNQTWTDGQYSEELTDTDPCTVENSTPLGYVVSDYIVCTIQTFQGLFCHNKKSQIKWSVDVYFYGRVATSIYTVCWHSMWMAQIAVVIICV